MPGCSATSITFGPTNTLPVAAIDTETRQIACGDAGAYGVREGLPYYVFNLLEELDLPGEWYLDRSTGILYFYPPGGLKTGSVQLSRLATPLVEAPRRGPCPLRAPRIRVGAAATAS